MTLLEIIQKFCVRTGLPSPATAFGTTDAQVLQAIGLLEEEVNDLAHRHDWSGLNHIASWTTLAAELQGEMETVAAPGFLYIKNNTIWDQTDQLPLFGPIDGQEWQRLDATNVAGPRYQWRIRDGKLYSFPAPPAGHIWAFEYMTKRPIMDTNGTTHKEFFEADTDTLMVPDHLALMGLRWRWMREKGLSYAELFNSYELQIKDAMGRDGGRPRLSMDDECKNIRPGIYINPMSWPL